ncbi:MAG: hypothetical protein D6731_03505 [Planctomycetota bacterium]|nr:MAG: hypothetical protein D6731_03505 [Planctomycetota bacterium]
MKRLGAALAFALAAGGPARAQEVLRTLEPATLDRAESPVVVRGARLQRLLGAPIDSLRLYAYGEQGLRPVPFQVDERTPQETYAYHHGLQRSSDTDERRLDTNDELVFMAADVGARVPLEAIRLGQLELEEVRVSDPSRPEAAGWVYALAFALSPPPPAERRYLELTVRQRELRGWRGPLCRVDGPPWGNNLLDMRSLRFRTASGDYGRNVLDRSKLSFQGSYLFLRLDRRLEEVYARLLGYLAGPVRLVADFRLQAYMIWGHWIETTRARLVLYHNRLELEFSARLPVTLERKRPSTLRFSLDFRESAGPLALLTDRNLTGLPADGRPREGRTVNRSFPRWVCYSLPGGAVLARFWLPERLARKEHSLFLAEQGFRDEPEDEPGSYGNAGFLLDLSGWKAGDDYEGRLVLQFGEPVGPGRPEALLRVDDAPLRAEVTSRP